MYDRIMKELPKMSLVSISTISDKFKVGGAIARQAMRELSSKDLIVRIGDHAQQCPLYRGAQWSLKKDDENKEASKKSGKKEKKPKNEE
jgi:ribosomal protein S25